MVRFLYRVLRLVNLVGSMEESQLRNVMTSSSVIRRLQALAVADLSKPLSYALPLTGNAMTPLLNPDVDDMRAKQDRLVIRRLAGTTQSFLNRVYVDDVVVIRDPNDHRRRYVRRIAALEGTRMVSKHGDSSFQVPPKHCWVERDNVQADAPDSSFFGPLALDYIIGRVMYAIRSATDHTRVPNSPYAMASDAIVMAQEPVSQYISPPAGNDPPQEKDNDAKPSPP